MSWKTITKRLIPQRLHRNCRRGWLRTCHFGLRHACPICRSRIQTFLPHGVPPAPNCVCPVCGSKAPHRLAWQYFSQTPELFLRGGLCLHIAPEPELGRWLSTRCHAVGMRYRSGSIMGHGDQYLDLLTLPFEDQSVDFLYCCHVLNSMPDDRAAMREVRRVLKPKGTAVLQVPAFHQGDSTLEASDEESRMRYFGDAAIFRCYTDADYTHRLRQADFEVARFGADALPSELVKRYQLKAEALHVATIPMAAR